MLLHSRRCRVGGTLMIFWQPMHVHRILSVPPRVLCSPIGLVFFVRNTPTTSMFVFFKFRCSVFGGFLVQWCLVMFPVTEPHGSTTAIKSMASRVTCLKCCCVLLSIAVVETSMFGHLNVSHQLRSLLSSSDAAGTCTVSALVRNVQWPALGIVCGLALRGADVSSRFLLLCHVALAPVAVLVP